MVRISAPLGVYFGGTHAVTGATAVVPTGGSVNPADATVGESFTWAFRTTGEKALSYTVTGLPPGIVQSAKVSSGVSSISGTPTTPGKFTVSIIGWENANQSGRHTAAYKLVINITGGVVPPTIASEPSGGVFTVGDNAILSVIANGTGMSYQWKRDGSPLPDQTSAQLTLNNITATDAGSYSVDISNSGGTVSSQAATIRVLDKIAVITKQPNGGTFTQGTDVVLSIAATGDQLTYQWTKNSQAIDGERETSLRLTNISLGNAGTYAVEVTNSGGTVTSDLALVQVILPMPSITTEPIGGSFHVGDTLTLSVTASGTDLAYLWKKDGNLLEGQDAPDFTISSLSTTDAGSYTVEISNSGGTVSSIPAIVHVAESATGFLAWQAATFAKANPTDSLPLADPDADGLDNLFEYYYQTDPLTAQSGPHPTAFSAKIDGVDYGVIEFAKSTKSPDISATIEISTHLDGDWKAIHDGDGGVQITETDQLIRVQIPLNTVIGFVRLSLTLTP